MSETSATDSTTASFPELLKDLRELVGGYVAERTIGPLRGLIRYVIFGIAGSVALGFGLVLLAVGLLRALQDTTGGFFGGQLNWLPYLITGAALMVMVGFAAAAAVKGMKRRKA